MSINSHVIHSISGEKITVDDLRKFVEALEDAPGTAQVEPSSYAGSYQGPGTKTITVKYVKV